MKVDHLNNLRALEAVLRTGGLRPAAQELGVTPAAVGQQIRNLEDTLGRSLLHRHPTGSTPTAHALAVAKTLTHHIAGLGQVLEQLQLQQDTNRVAVSLLPGFAETWLSRHLASLFAVVPGIDLRLDASRKLVNLAEGDYDFAIRYAQTPPADVNHALLLDDYCAPVCTPDFAKRYDLTPDSPSLSTVPMAEIDILKKSAVPGLVDWCDHYGITPPNPKAGQIILDYDAGSKMAGSGLAIFLAGLHDAIDGLENGSLILPFGRAKTLLNAHKFWLIWRSDRRLSSHQKKFLSWIKDHAAADQDRIKRFLTG